MSKAYTRAEFEAQYPDEDACLEALFYLQFGKLTCCPKCGVVSAQFYRVKGRRCYACVHCRGQLFPTAGTIMHRSTTPLKSWFRVLYMFHLNKNGVAALELQRKLGGTYKRAARVSRQIRKALKQENEKERKPLSGIVEVDEAYIGGRRRSSNRFKNKVVLMGAVERHGRIRIQVVGQANATTALRFLRETVAEGSRLQTDESGIYNRAHRTYEHHKVKHSDYEFVRENDYTNTIEGAWGLLKPSWRGTYRSVSRQYMPFYVHEFVWKYNRREEPILFHLLLDAVAQPIAKDPESVAVRP